MSIRRVVATTRVAAALVSVKVGAVGAIARVIDAQSIEQQKVRIALAFRVQGAVQVAASHVIEREVEGHEAQFGQSVPHAVIDVGAHLVSADIDLSSPLLNPVAKAASSAAKVAAAKSAILGHTAQVVLSAGTIAMGIAVHAIEAIVNVTGSLIFGDAVLADDVLFVQVTWGRGFDDSVVSTDALNSLLVGKVLSDAQGAADAAVLATSLVKTDAVSVTDAKVVGFSKALTDALGATDAKAFHLTRPDITDSVTVMDVLGFIFFIVVNEDVNSVLNSHRLGEGILGGSDTGNAVVTGDWTFLHPNLGKSDSVSLSDAINKFDLAKGLLDTPLATDAKAFHLDRPNITDTATVGDDATVGIGFFREFFFDEITSVLGGAMLLNEWPLHESDQADLVIVSDHFLGWLTGKNLADSQAVADAINTASLGKVLTDAVTPSEALVKSASLVKTDSAAPTEAKAYSLSKPLADSVTPSEALAKAMFNPLSDSVTPSEATAKLVGKPFADSVSPSDVLGFWYFLEFSGGITSLIGGNQLLNEFPLNDSDRGETVIVNEFISILLHKGLADSATPVDDMVIQAVDAMLNGEPLNEAVLN